MRYYGYIYCHTSLATGKHYIGSCLAGQQPNIDKLLERWNAGYGYKLCPKLFAEIEAIGFKNLIHRFIEFEFTADDEKEAHEILHSIEYHYIAVYDTINHGLNCRSGKIYTRTIDIEELPAIYNWKQITEELKPKHLKYQDYVTAWHNYGKLGHTVAKR